MTTPKLDLTAMLASQAQGRFFGPQHPDAYDKATNIVVAGNGIFRVVKTPVALFKTKLTDIPAANRLPGLGDMTEGPELLIPKIPLKYLIMILTFYKDVHNKDKTEASALFFWNHDNITIPTEYEDKTPVNGVIEDGQLIVYCPTQKNSGTLSEFGNDGMVDYLRKNCTPLCETHSHHTMAAFWSGTDDANENMTQFYGVWGKIFTEQPDFLFRWVCGDKKVNIDASVLFDLPQFEIKTVTTTTCPLEGIEPQVVEKIEHKSYNGPWQRVEPPEDWMGQHSKSTYYPATQKGKGTTYARGTAYQSSLYDGYDYYDYGASYPYARTTPSYQKDEVDSPITTPRSTKHQKKTDVTLQTKTAVEIFMEGSVLGDNSIPDAEAAVEYLVEQLILEGYDHVISDTIQEKSGYSTIYEDEYI